MSSRKLTLSGVCLALCMVLPFLTLQTVALGNMFSLIHIPVFLCGFVCGWPYGICVGFLAPFLRHLLFGMPHLYPNAVAMAFELAAYGASVAILYRKLPKKMPFLYVSLLGAMLLGRLVWGGVMLLIFDGFTFSYFIAAEFIKAFPGILCHLILVPPLAKALERTVFGRERDL